MATEEKSIIARSGTRSQLSTAGQLKPGQAGFCTDQKTIIYRRRLSEVDRPGELDYFTMEKIGSVQADASDSDPSEWSHLLGKLSEGENISIEAVEVGGVQKVRISSSIPNQELSVKNELGLNFEKAHLSGNYHVGLGSALFENDLGNTVLITRQAEEHGFALTGGKIVRYKNDSGGFDFSSLPVPILDTASKDDRDFAFGKMDSNRIGLFVSVYASYPRFLYSDDGGDTWTAVQLSTLPTNFFAWNEIVKYPTTVGGSDAGGWIVFGAIEGISDGIRFAKTLNNGLTWTHGIAVSSASSVLASEPSVARIGNADLWVMVYRDNSANLQGAWISTSSDLLNWSDPLQLDFTLGKNPPLLFWHKENLYLFGTMRTDLTFAEWRNKIVACRISRAEAEVLDFSGFSDSNFEVIASLENILGYLRLGYRIDGGLVGSVAYSEAPRGEGTNSRIAIISDIPQISRTGARSFTDSNGKTWKVIEDKGNRTIEFFGFGIAIPYGSATNCFTTVNYPESVPQYVNAMAEIVPLSFSIANLSWRAGAVRADTFTPSSFRAIVQGANDLLASGDYVTANIHITIFLKG